MIHGGNRLDFYLTRKTHVMSGVCTCGPVVSSTAVLVSDFLNTVGYKVELLFLHSSTLSSLNVMTEW